MLEKILPWLLVLLSIAALIWLLTPNGTWLTQQWKTVTTLTNPPTPFLANTCFARNGIREPWQPPVDGIIVQRGYEHYLVMFYEQADRRHAGDKKGVEISFETMHSLFHESTCPKGWVKDEQ